MTDKDTRTEHDALKDTDAPDEKETLNEQESEQAQPEAQPQEQPNAPLEDAAATAPQEESADEETPAKKEPRKFERPAPPPSPFAAFFRILIALFVFLLVYGANVGSTVYTSYDSRWTVPMAVSILNDFDTNLNEYREEIEASGNYGVREIDGDIHSVFPVAPALVAVPFVWFFNNSIQYVMEEIPRVRSMMEERTKGKVDLDKVTALEVKEGVELLAAGFVAALAAMLCYLAFSSQVGVLYGLPPTLIFAFCTPAWSTAGRGLWQHGPSMLMLAAALWLLLREERKPGSSRFAGVPLTLAYFFRPTNSVAVGLLALYILVRRPKQFIPFLSGCAFTALPFILFHFTVFGDPLAPYYYPREGTFYHDWQAILSGLGGILFSPSRGLFIFSPILLFVFSGILIKLKAKTFTLLDVFLILILGAHTVLLAMYWDWPGGHCYGPRYFTDVMPLFVYFLVPMFAWFKTTQSKRKIHVMGVFVLLALLSFAIHFRGANSWDVYLWNSTPVDMIDAKERVWDFKDPQFLRGIFSE